MINKQHIARKVAELKDRERRALNRPPPDTAFRDWLDAALLLPLDERIAKIVELEPHQVERLRYVWRFFARPAQLPPAPPWTFWLILAGRGFGKTRCGSEQVRVWARSQQYVNIIGATSDDARDIMVEGESGLLSICPNHERPTYLPSKRRLEWPNGAVSLIFTADEPERLRGKQHSSLWMDELAAWRYAQEAWDQAILGLRLGANPQAVVTTTPRPNALIKGLLANPACVVSRGTTHQNRNNLAPSFLASIIIKFEGTRLGRQELSAEMLDDNPGALWKRTDIDAGRVDRAPTLRRIVVGVDPAVTSSEDSDWTGIVVAGIADDGQYYVLADNSLQASPNEWGQAAINAYHKHKADRVIGEVNNGGDLIEALLRTIDRNVSYTKVTATRGKAIRAEPIAALYEQGRVHHVGSLAELEDQMCDYDPVTSKKSPDRMDALVWALTELSDSGGADGLIEYYRQAAANQKRIREDPALVGQSPWPTASRPIA